MPDWRAMLLSVPTLIIVLRPWYGTVTIITLPGLWKLRCEPTARMNCQPFARNTADTRAYGFAFTRTPAP